MDRHGVYGLQRNLLVENIIDVYKQESERSDQESVEFLFFVFKFCTLVQLLIII